MGSRWWLWLARWRLWLGCSLGHWRSDRLRLGITELELRSTGSSLYTTSYRSWWRSTTGPVLLFLSCSECLLSERPFVPQRMATCPDNSTAITYLGLLLIETIDPHALNRIAVRAEPEGTTGETTSHLTKAASCQVIGYSHFTRLSKDDNQVAGYVEAQESIHISTRTMQTDSRIMSAGSINCRLPQTHLPTF